jgi:hypothetical protein
MVNLISRFGLGLLLFVAIPASTLLAQAPKTVTVPKCQACGTKAAKTLQSCMAAGGNSTSNAQACQKSYQKKMTHCTKKYCTPKTTKVKVNTAS